MSGMFSDSNDPFRDLCSRSSFRDYENGGIREIVNTIRSIRDFHALAYPELDSKLFDFAKRAEHDDALFLEAAMSLAQVEDKFKPKLVISGKRSTTDSVNCVESFYDLSSPSHNNSLALFFDTRMVASPDRAPRSACPYKFVKLGQGTALMKISHTYPLNFSTYAVCLHPKEFDRQVDNFVGNREVEYENLLALLSASHARAIDELTSGARPKEKRILKREPGHVEIEVDYDFNTVSVEFSLSNSWELTSRARAA